MLIERKEERLGGGVYESTAGIRQATALVEAGL